MFILGDVFFVVFVVLFSGLSLWASGVIVAVLFQDRTAISARAFETAFWKTFLLGLAVGAPIAFLGAALMSNPVTRLFGFLFYGAIIALALFGNGGLTKCVATRIQRAGGAKSDYDALAKGGLLYVLFAMFPFFGWFIVAPIMLLTSLGAGVKALFKAERVASASEAA